MLFFIVFLVIFGVVIWKYLPETKGKSFADIAKILGIPTVDDNDNDDTQTPLVSPLFLHHACFRLLRAVFLGDNL